jgi:hypothetical protein
MALREWSRPPHRRSDWPQRLASYLAGAADRPHVYGRHDCLLHIANAVEALTGRDYAEGQRGKYRSAAGASRYLRSLGFGTPEDLLDSLFPETPVAFAQRGDIVMGEDGIPGLCIGGEAAFVGDEDGRDGLVIVPRAEWRKAWKV